jgi:Tfp pilus assembly protein PilF/4-amino-4-deoxy-L-arabinose transferase-like glycosyltransferase
MMGTMASPHIRIEKWLTAFDEALESNKLWLITLALIAFAVKAAYVLESAQSLQIRVPIMDALHYDKTAVDILRGGVVRDEAFFMGPLYSYFLAAVYAIFGRDYTVVRLIQAVGGSLTVVVTYFLGRRLFRPSIGFVGAVLLVLYGATTFYETQLLMMWLGTLLNLTCLFLLVRMGPNARWRAYLVPGFVLGLSALARANIFVFVPVAVVWILLARETPDRLKKAAAFFAAVVVAVLPATVHNYAVSRDFIPVTANAGINFYIGNGEFATGIFYPPPGTDFFTDATTRTYVERLMGRDMTPSEISGYWTGLAFDFIRSDPAAALALFWRKVALFFNGYEIPQIESFDLTRRQYVTLTLLIVNYWFIGSIGILGLLFSLPRWRRLLPLQGYVVAYALSIALFFVTARYRAQIAPVMALFAAYALLDAFPRFITGPRRGIAVAGLAATVLLLTHPSLFALDDKEVAYREHIHTGRRAGVAGEYQTAVSEVDDAVALFPDYYEGYVHRAIVHNGGGDHFKAIEDYTRALELRDDLSGTHYDLGQTFRKVNMKRQAIEEYKKAIALDSLMVKAYNNLGITYVEIGEFQQAVDCFQTVIDLDPNYAKAYNNLGAVLAENNRVDDAIATFLEAIRRDPAYASSYRNLANAYVQNRQIGPAIESLTQYLKLVPNDETARENLQKLHYAAAQDSSAAQ